MKKLKTIALTLTLLLAASPVGAMKQVMLTQQSLNTPAITESTNNSFFSGFGLKTVCNLFDSKKIVNFGKRNWWKALLIGGATIGGGYGLYRLFWAEKKKEEEEKNDIEIIKVEEIVEKYSKLPKKNNRKKKIRKEIKKHLLFNYKTGKFDEVKKNKPPENAVLYNPKINKTLNLVIGMNAKKKIYIDADSKESKQRKKAMLNHYQRQRKDTYLHCQTTKTELYNNQFTIEITNSMPDKNKLITVQKNKQKEKAAGDLYYQKATEICKKAKNEDDNLIGLDFYIERSNISDVEIEKIASYCKKIAKEKKKQLSALALDDDNDDKIIIEDNRSQWRSL